MKKIFVILFAALLSFAASNSYSANVDVTATTGTLSAGYTSLDLALAQVGVLHTGVVTVKINTGHALTATATIGNSNFTSCLIYPTAAVTLTSALTANVIFLNGADNVTIDGRINAVANVGNVNSLTLTCTGAGSTLRAVQVSNGSQNFTIRNVNVNIPVMTTAATGGRCVNIAQSTTIAQGGQDNATIKYCNLNGGDRTLQTFGSAGFNVNTNTVIYGNKIRNFASLGIFLGSDVIDVTCDSNEVYHDAAVYLGGAAGTSARGIGMQAHGTCLIQRNIIHDIGDNGVRTTAISVQGMICIPVISVAPLLNPVTNVTIQNNIIRLAQNNIKSTTTYGLFVTATAAASALDYNAKVYNNTSLIGGTGTLAEFTYALILDIPNSGSVNAPPTGTYYNNVGLNVRSALTGSQHVGMDFEVEPGVVTISDFNTAYADGTAAGNTYFNTVDAAFGYNSIFGWKDVNSAPGNEQNSAMHPVNYDVNFQLSAANYGDLNGKVLAAVPTDIFGTTKAAVYPYRGAVEGAALKTLTVTAGLEGRTGSVNSDMFVSLFNGCTFVDYASSFITDVNGSPVYCFAGAVSNATPYNVQCLTPTHLESWTATTVTFTGGVASYVFNSPASVYGGNGTVSGQFIAGDVTQTGEIDAADLAPEDNDIAAGLSSYGWLSTDQNYDGFVDAGDGSLVDNNAAIGYYLATPCPSPNVPTEAKGLFSKNKRTKLSTDKSNRINLVTGN